MPVPVSVVSVWIYKVCCFCGLLSYTLSLIYSKKVEFMNKFKIDLRGRSCKVSGYDCDFLVEDVEGDLLFLRSGDVKLFLPESEVKLLEDDLVAYPLSRYLYNKRVRDIGVLVDLYNVLFEPELIYKLFEGVHINNSAGLNPTIPRGDLFEVADGVFLVFDNVNRYKVLLEDRSYEYGWPGTLDCFLHDLIRSGVYMKWRKDVYYKYH